MCEKNFSPTFYASLPKFIETVSEIFWADEAHKNPVSFAREMISRPYILWCGGASFYVIPTPYNEWGWMYETISGRQLIWLPGNIIYTRYLQDSVNFRGWLEDTLGAPLRLEEPRWLNTALEIAIVVPRIGYDCYEDSKEELAKALEDVEELANILREIVSQRPLDYLAKVVEPPDGETEHLYDYYADVMVSAEEAEKERIWAAYKALQRRFLI